VKHQIKKYLKDFIAIIVLVVLAAAVGGYILGKERLQFPLISPKPVSMYADFSTAQAVTPGQGQTVNVSGVQVGMINAVKLQGGVARVQMGIDPTFKHLMHTDATALLRPKTGLKDMFIELNPGTKQAPVAKPGFVIPVRNTLPDVNPDEILASLDTDTRQYLQLLIGGAGQGLYNSGHALQAVLVKFRPTVQDLETVNGAVATRHANLSRLIRSLNLLNQALAERGPQISRLVSTSSQVFHAFASEQGNIQQALAEFPGALTQTTDTLGKVHTFANVLGPTSRDLIPAVRALPAANAALTPFARKTTPVLATQIRPFVINSRPLVRSLKPAAQDLAKATPNLTNTFVALNHLFNMLGYNESGPNASVSDPKRNEGYLFWLAWLNHNAASVFGDSDANGTMRALTQQSTCETLNSSVGGINTQLGLASSQLLGTLNVLLDNNLCGASAPGGGTGLPNLPNLPSVPNVPTVPVPVPPLPLAGRNGAAKTAAKSASATNARYVTGGGR
jgi:phospholipid/cholesterol/gamma-HCH transport system substrate-binding protein